MPAKPAFPNPAATLPGEADILANVLANLADHDAKLVYADWLEEHGDMRGPLLRECVTAHREGKKLPEVTSAPQPWRDLVGVTLMAKLSGSALAPKGDTLLALARPAITHKITQSSDLSLPVAGSKLGGRPDLPAGTEWPQYEGGLLSFLGQFNLADVQGSPVARDLPATGLLSAFCLYQDGEDVFPEGTWRLFYFPDEAELVRREFDEGLAPESRFSPCRVEYSEALTLPHPWAAKQLRLKDAPPADDVYFDLCIGLCAGGHILGHSFPIQGYTLEKKGERHLLTVCGNEAAGWEFAGGGQLYFVTDAKRLRDGKFDRVDMKFDCG